ncbi:MAG TPA: alpha/beta hydrolase [Candidatus Acidoferrales bacterium]|jgi:pimeloyl-ACP methyl ester carboxylesterase|nr:alpha/beta hydrolase [Candidatus Acidoferrales bacterium]
MPANIEHMQVKANGITFHVAVAGANNAPPIFCLHGFPEGWQSWRPIMELLSNARIVAPDLRGYGQTEHPADGYDVFTLTDDIRALMETLGIDRPLLVSHDWGGALGWIFAHRYSSLIRRLVVINCTHPKTLVRAVLRFEDFQTIRIPWVPFFEIPWLPEAFMSSALGRKLLKLSFTLREGQKGTMNVALVDELVERFQTPADLHGPINYYRRMVETQLVPEKRARLDAVYATPISVPVTLVWGAKDGALSARVAMNSALDAGCEVELRPLPGVGHFVSLEAAGKLALELQRIIVQLRNP